MFAGTPWIFRGFHGQGKNIPENIPENIQKIWEKLGGQENETSRRNLGVSPCRVRVFHKKRSEIPIPWNETKFRDFEKVSQAVAEVLWISSEFLQISPCLHRHFHLSVRGLHSTEEPQIVQTLHGIAEEINRLVQGTSNVIHVIPSLYMEPHPGSTDCF